MIPVILSGGSGTRLWPVSRASYPKQFCDFYDRSFLESTLERISDLNAPYILTVESMRNLTIKSLSAFNVPEDNILYEPFGKNTGPAIALLCHVLHLRGLGNETVAVLPSDHIITQKQVFKKALALAGRWAEKGRVATIGIEPRYPATGYGYIETKGEKLETYEDLDCMAVESFHEKPNSELAEKYLQSGRYYWNAGMFVFKVDSMIESFRQHLPEVWDKISQIKADMSNLKYSYANIESVSMDHGIMEKLENQVCVPVDMGWSDVGSWDEIARLSDEEASLKTESHAEVVHVESQGNYVFSNRKKVVGLIGVSKLIVVDTPDALLISKRGDSQKVKDVVDELKNRGMPEASEHVFEKRPWGGYEIISDAEEYKCKKISVDPGAQLSYQTHKHRDEHWIIISGQAEIILEDQQISKKSGEYIFIEREKKHRIKNVGANELIFIEVQTGNYFGEDDIVRYDDDYSRHN